MVPPPDSQMVFPGAGVGIMPTTAVRNELKFISHQFLAANEMITRSDDPQRISASNLQA